MNRNLTDNLKEIAEQLDCGFRAFKHKNTGQFFFVPNHLELHDIDLDPWEELLDQLENNFEDYIEIEKWTSNEAFEAMHEFADQLTDKSLQKELLKALNKNKPFREFKFIIDHSDRFRQQWFDFKNQWQQDFVAKQLRHLT